MIIIVRPGAPKWPFVVHVHVLAGSTCVVLGFASVVSSTDSFDRLRVEPLHIIIVYVTFGAAQQFWHLSLVTQVSSFVVKLLIVVKWFDRNVVSLNYSCELLHQVFDEVDANWRKIPMIYEGLAVCFILQYVFAGFCEICKTSFWND